MSKIRILLIEDNHLLRERVAALLDAQADMRVVGAWGGYQHTLHRARMARAQVILIDVSCFPRVVSLTKLATRFRVIGTGLVPEQSDIVAAVRSGASGFILNDAIPGEFLSTIRAVAQGAVVLPFFLGGSLFSYVLEHVHWKEGGEPPDTVRMTKREREISKLIADGLTNKEIAQQINVATYTVKSHVHNILEKRGLHSRLEIVKYAYQEPRLIRVNENYVHSLAASPDHTNAISSNRRMALHPMYTLRQGGQSSDAGR